jgi:hypothetical protein
MHKEYSRFTKRVEALTTQIYIIIRLQRMVNLIFIVFNLPILLYFLRLFQGS